MFKALFLTSLKRIRRVVLSMLSVQNIRSRTYSNQVFYQHRTGDKQHLVPAETVSIMKDINDELYQFSMVRKKKHRQKRYAGGGNGEKWRASKPVIFEAATNYLEDAKKKITKLLNKLSHPNVDVITGETITVFQKFGKDLIADKGSVEDSSCLVEWKQLVEYFITQLLHKAITEPLFYQDYVFLVDSLVTKIEFDHVSSLLIGQLQSKCQQILEKLLNQIASVEGRGRGGKEMIADIFKVNGDMKGFCQLLSELYLHQKITLSVVSECLDDLQVIYNNVVEEEGDKQKIDRVVENYCYICYPLIKSEYFPIETYLQPIRDWSSQKKVSPKVRFLMSDLLEDFDKIDKK